MARENFISDHLVDMRDRLKQNAESLRQHETPASASSQTPSGAVPTPAAAAVEEKLPLQKGFSGSTETDRERRDLEGRLRRDLAASEVTLVRLRGQAERTEEYQRILAELLKKLEDIGSGETLGGAEYAKDIERMRLQYFQSFGRYSAECAISGSSSGNAENTEPSGRTRGTFFTGICILIAAVLISAAIVFSIAL